MISITVQENITNVLEEVQEKGERRNAYVNLAWTGPIDNAFLADNISLGKVENVAADTFLQGLPTDGAAETAADSQEAADDADTRPQSKPRRRAVETLSETARRPWQMPGRVEKGFEIPIMITSPFVELEIGKFKRWGIDVVVNAVWLAYFWAKQEGSRQAATALEKLILDWPFDFIRAQGNSTAEIEERKFKWAVTATGALRGVASSAAMPPQGSLGRDRNKVIFSKWGVCLKGDGQKNSRILKSLRAAVITQKAGAPRAEPKSGVGEGL